MITASRARHLPGATLALAFACLPPLLGACASTGEAPKTPPSPIEVLPQDVLTTPVQPDEKIIAQELRAIEAAFARRSCTQVREHETRLAPLRKSKLTLPLSALVALAVCEAEAKPADTAAQDRAVALLGEAQRNLAPAMNVLFLEEIKAERLQAAGEPAKALEARKRMREHIASLDATRVRIDGEILRQSHGEKQLSEAQRGRYQEALRLWPQDDKLFEAQRTLDDLLAEVVNAEARALLLEARTRVVARIEDDFATEASLVESRMREGREAEAREMAARMKERFPRENYARRVDALVGVVPSNATLGAGTTGTTSASDATTSGASGTAPGTAPFPLGTDTASQASGTIGSPDVPATPEAALDGARRALDAGRPDDAVRALDSLPEGLQNDRTRRLRREAVDVHVRNVRTQVRNLYNRAGATTGKPAKAQILRDAKKLLEDLLTRYPDAPGRSGIERNLRTINQDLEGTAP